MSIFGENYILLDEGVVYRNSNENMCIVVNGSRSTDKDRILSIPCPDFTKLQ